MLKIIFGQDLDGYQTPQPTHACGEAILGPLGFLDFLETRLGLRGLNAGEPVRIIQYLDGLQRADDGHRFYSPSLAVDELAVARTLLGWRDTWIEAGWTGKAREADSRRLRDLAEVEALCAKRLAPGWADRLVAVRDALAEQGLPGIRILLKEPIEAFSAGWEAILSRLETVEDDPDAPWAVGASQGCDLALLQEAVLKNTPVRLRGDGTVLYLTAQNQGLLARGAAQILHGRLDTDASPWFNADRASTVIDGGDGHVLDRAFDEADLPLTGSSRQSRWRVPLQVLPLTLSLLWTPLDPYRLLEFLTHPVCPLPRFARQRLAKVVAEFPGIGGKPWQEAIAKLKSEAVKRADGAAAAGDKLGATIEEWLDGPRFDAAAGAPLAPIAETCRKLACWAAGQAQREGLAAPVRELFYDAAAQASQMQQTLDQMADLGREAIGRLQLERLVEQITCQGVALPSLKPEVGHMHLIGSPAAAIEANERILWWNFREPHLPSRWPWSVAELQQLAENGIKLPTVESRLQFLARTWLRPLFAATRQIIFAVPETAGEETVRQHPLRARLDALTDKTIPERDMGALLCGNVPDAGLALTLGSVGHQSLPQPVRWWQLQDPQLLGPRTMESFSSLQAFIESPYQWVLRYKGGFYPAALARIDDGNRQKGNLLHRFIERLFVCAANDWRTMRRAELAAWVEEEFQQLLEEEGANYLLPGKIKDRQELEETTESAIWTLLEHLRAAKVVRVDMEKEVAGSFAGGGLCGSIDMLLTNRKGEEAVLDLKWGAGRYRMQELRDNRGLQLLLYAYLRKVRKRWPAQGYYILSEGRLLAQDARFFPQAEACSPPEGETEASLWLAFEKDWQWRRAQLNEGRIEVTVAGTQADAASEPPEGALAIDEFNDRFNDFAVLTGWKEEGV
jgi:RecB family exonuclease